MLPSLSWLEEPTHGDADRLAFEEHTRVLTATWWPRLGLVIAGAALVWWPTDLLVFPDPAVTSGMAWLRLRLVVLNLFLVSVLPRLASAYRHALPLAFLSAASNLAIVGWSLPPLDGGGVPGLAYSFMAPMFSVLLPVSLRTRLLAAFGLPGALIGAWLASGQSDPSAPGVAASLSFLVFCSGLCVFIGHMVYALLRRSFHLNLQLERQREALAGWSGQLELRVAEQTEALRSMHERAREAQDAQRREIAREVHDSMGQELLSLRLLLGVARQEHAEPVITRTLTELENQVQRLQQSLRRVLEALRPPALAEVGLVGALTGMVQDLERRSGLDLILETRGVREPLPGPVALAVYRVTQEALNNAIRHARARHIRVGLVQEERMLRLAVADDGGGVPPGGLGSGFGTRGIIERVAALGGTVRWQTESGTRLDVAIPLPECG